MNEQQKQELIKFVTEEAHRMQYGKLYVEVTVHKGKVTNAQAETKRSYNLNT